MQLLKTMLRQLIWEITDGFGQFGACLCLGAEGRDDSKESV